MRRLVLFFGRRRQKAQDEEAASAWENEGGAPGREA
jgi:hypothetical protein